MTNPILDLTRPGDILRPFPPVEDVFVPKQVGLARHLHPLVSVNLEAVNPGWSGWVHVVGPIEPYAGLLGEHTVDFHDTFVRTNAFIVALDGNRYHFKGDSRYFLMAHAREDLPQHAQVAHDELAVHYEEAEAAFRRAEASYRKHGRLYMLDDKGRISSGNTEPQPFIEQLGGATPYANWTVTTEFPVEPAVKPGGPEPKQVWPLSPAGRRFEFVASTPGWLYRRDGADSILLFYEPVEKLVLLTFDWT